MDLDARRRKETQGGRKEDSLIGPNAVFTKNHAFTPFFGPSIYSVLVDDQVSWLSRFVLKAVCEQQQL